MSQLCSRCDELFIAAFDVVTAPLTDGDSGEPLAYEDLPNGVFGRKFWLWEEWQSSAIYGLCHFCHLLYKARWMENAPRPLEELYYDIERIAKHDSPGGQWDEAILRLWTKRTMKERHAWDEQTQHRVTFRIAQPRKDMLASSRFTTRVLIRSQTPGPAGPISGQKQHFDIFRLGYRLVKPALMDTVSARETSHNLKAPAASLDDCLIWTRMAQFPNPRSAMLMISIVSPPKRTPRSVYARLGF